MPVRFIALLAAAAFAQQTPPLRVSVTLVQVDAVVTGRDGRQVTDLTKDDFEILEDGHARAITHFSYVRTAGRSTPVPAAGVALRREDVRRTLALVVDDLRMSYDSIQRAREALTQFVDRYMGPGDLVAIVSTSGGIGPLEQFTTDKRALRGAIARLRFRLDGGGATDSVETLGMGGSDATLAGALSQRRFAMGTLAAVRLIAFGMRDLPGRKALVLVSDGLSMKRLPGKREGMAMNEMRRASDGANRAAVVIHALDPRGLFVPGPQAKDDTGALGVEELSRRRAVRLRREAVGVRTRG
jgi:VWFA-related protein